MDFFALLQESMPLLTQGLMLTLQLAFSSLFFAMIDTSPSAERER